MKTTWKYPIEVAPGMTVEAELRIEDVDQDGDADLVVYVGGMRAHSVEFSKVQSLLAKVAKNIAAEAGRVRKRVRKAVKK